MTDPDRPHPAHHPDARLGGRRRQRARTRRMRRGCPERRRPRPRRRRSPTVTDEPTAEQPTAAPDAPPVGEDIAALADVPVGGSIDATINGAPALIAQPTAGQVVAFSAICTHQQCVVAAAGNEFDCPCHGSRFDAATGDVLNGPALEPLSAIPVAVSGDRIVATS